MSQEKVLFLGPKDSPLISWLREQGEKVTQAYGKISTQFVINGGFTFLVSYGYRHILRKDVLNLFRDKAINLHISYLPWNRGADPNFWSFLDNTPKGVTIHYLDEGIDTGDIIVQKRLEFSSDHETLATTYEKLHQAIQELFKKNWSNIKSGTCQRIKQSGTGSIHRKKDKESFSHLLISGWDTPISVLNDYTKKNAIPTDSKVKE